MLLTNFLTFIGALGCGLFTWGDDNVFYGVMIAMRFILGIGVGGKYPLSAAVSSESSKKEDMSTNVAKGFFWQTPGCMLPYIIGLFIVLGYGNLDDKWVF